MAAIRSRAAEFICILALLAVAAGGVDSIAGAQDLVDAPVVWYDDDSGDIDAPRPRHPSLMWEGPQSIIARPLARATNPGRLVRRVGTAFGGDHVKKAGDINPLGEVLNSSWFTNRIGLFSLTPDEVANGGARDALPDRSAPWTVIKAKTEGVTPGFSIRDARGDVYVIKFDPPDFPRTTLTAGVVSSRIFWAIGFNVPQDNIVLFDRKDLVIEPDITYTTGSGVTKTFGRKELDELLARLPTLPDGRYFALASKFLSGDFMGPFDYEGRRKDDPNDRIRHQDRRLLRGLRIFAAWLNHFDTKQHNSLDMYVEEDGRRFVKHHLIDFASTLGAGGKRPVNKPGYEYEVDYAPVFGRIFTLGILEIPWYQVHRPEGLPEVGYFTAEDWDPLKWKPQNPNDAFADMTDRDGYWAAKIVSAFTDEQIEAILREARYQDPGSIPYLKNVLVKRRDIIARTFFDRIPPLDFFRMDGGSLVFDDLGAERGIYPGTNPRYRVRVAAVDSGRDAADWSEWIESGRTELTLTSGPAAAVMSSASEQEFPFLAVECAVDRGEGWSGTVTAYAARAGGRVVAVDR